MIRSHPRPARAAVLLAGILAAALAAALLLASCASGGPPQAGDQAPAATLTDLETGQAVKVPSDLAGRPFALTFFSYG